MFRQVGRALSAIAITLLLIVVSSSQARTEPPRPTSPPQASGARAQELPARQLPAVWATSYWNAARVKAAAPRAVARDADTLGYSVGANVALGVRSNHGLLVKQGTSTLSALWPDNDVVRRATGKIFFSMAGAYYTCSGTVVTDTSTQRSVVLTAAHCVYDHNYGYAQNWMFVPNYVDADVPADFDGSYCGQARLGCWTATSMIVSRWFANQTYFSDTATRHDYAFVSVGLGGSNGTSQLDRVVQPLPIRSSAISGASTWALGYPAGMPYDGNKLIYSNTPLGRDGRNDNRTFRIGSIMTEGSSGGPWLQGLPSSPVIVSVTSYGYDDDPHLQGPVFTSETLGMRNAVTRLTGVWIY